MTTAQVWKNILLDMDMRTQEQIFRKAEIVHKLIKDDEETKDIPVVIFSSLVNEEMKRKGVSLGANAQLSKPEIGNLVKVIDSLVLK